MSKAQHSSKINIRSMEECAEKEKHPTEARANGDARGRSVPWSHGRRPAQEEGRSAVMMLHQVRERLKQPLSLTAGRYW